MLVHPRNHWRVAIAGISSVIALSWVVALLAWPTSAEPALLLLNGLLVGIYGGGFGLAHPGSRGVACIVASWVLGISHPLWLLIIVVVFELVEGALRLSSGRSVTGAVMFIGTGLVFALAFGLATRSWRTVLAMLGGTVLAGLIAADTSVSVLSGAIGYACAPLHLGIAGGLGWSAWTALRMDRPGQMCEHCQYDLRGLTTDRCPECGTPVP